MKNKNPIFSNLALKSTIFLSPLLLSIAFISGYTVLSATAQVLSNQEREDLARLRKETKTFEGALTRTNTLLNIWLTILSLFPVALIAILWFFRRAVIREIVERAIQQIQGIENLQAQLTTVQEEAKKLINLSQNTTQELAEEVNNLKQKIQNYQIIYNQIYITNKKLRNQ